MKTLLLALIPLVCFASDPPPQQAAAKKLKEYLTREKGQFEQRETQRRDLIEELDRLNAQQNNVRQKMLQMTVGKQEMTVGLENLALEYSKQKDLERQQRQYLYGLLKLVYRVKKDGGMRFILNGQDLSQLAGRVRVLYRTLRSHSQVTKKLQERAERLVESERRLAKLRVELSSLMEDLTDQASLLTRLLDKKKRIVFQINRKQAGYQAAAKEYKRLSAELAQMFSKLEEKREPRALPLPRLSSLPFPVMGKVLKHFGRSIHEKFKTVTYQKGIEITAEQQAEVKAILPGTVEFDGWVRGLGNVVIIHHGGGFYSLSGYLFKVDKTKGAQVAQGDVIGLVGDTGGNEYPSLYFELRENGKAVDPLPYLDKAPLT